MKSLPNKGPETSPTTKSHSVVKIAGEDDLKVRDRRRSPPVAIGVPLTVSNGGTDEEEPGEEQGPGSMLTEAPVSTKYFTPVMWS